MATLDKNGNIIFPGSQNTGIGIKANAPGLGGLNVGLGSNNNTLSTQFTLPKTKPSPFQPNANGGLTYTGTNTNTGITAPKANLGIQGTAGLKPVTPPAPVSGGGGGQQVVAPDPNADKLAKLADLKGQLAILQARKAAEDKAAADKIAAEQAAAQQQKLQTQGTTQNGAYNPYAPSNQMYGQIASGLANIQDPNNPMNQAYNQANENLAKLNAEYAQQQANIEGTPGSLAMAGGQEGILQRLFAQKQAAAQGQLSNALTGRAQTIGALGTAAGLAAPQQVGYNVQYTNPLTGQPYGGGQASGSLQDAVSGAVEKLKAGTMTYNDALTALSGYGQGGINALQAALPAGFNISQSNTLGGQQGSIGPAYSFAKSALENLKNITSNLGAGTLGSLGLQGSNIPAGNSIGNWISTTFGVDSAQTRQYIGAVQEARNAYSQLLAASRGGTPSAYTDQANAAIPDNATPNDIAAAISNLESLGQSKLNIYGNPGQSSTGTSPNGSTNTNIFSW